MWTKWAEGHVLTLQDSQYQNVYFILKCFLEHEKYALCSQTIGNEPDKIHSKFENLHSSLCNIAFI